jgi:hypothetical protein
MDLEFNDQYLEGSRKINRNMRVNDDSTFDGASQMQRHDLSMSSSQDFRTKLSIEIKRMSDVMMRQEI